MIRLWAFAVCAAVVVAALAACAPTTATPGITSSPSPTKANLAILEEDAPAGEPTVDLGLAVDQPGAARFVGAAGGAEAFAVESGDSQICFVLTGESINTVASCHENAYFNEQGIELTVTDPPVRSYYLVPDGAQGPSSAEKIAENFWVTTD